MPGPYGSSELQARYRKIARSTDHSSSRRGPWLIGDDTAWQGLAMPGGGIAGDRTQPDDGEPKADINLVPIPKATVGNGNQIARPAAIATSDATRSACARQEAASPR